MDEHSEQWKDRDLSPRISIDTDRKGPDTEPPADFVPPFHPFGGSNDPRDQIIQKLERRIRELEEKMEPLQNIQTSAGGESDYDPDRVIIDVEADAESELPVSARRVVRGTAPESVSYDNIQTALEEAYTIPDPSLRLSGGDLVELTDNGSLEFCYIIAPDNDAQNNSISGQSGDDVERVKITVNDVTRTAYRVDSGGDVEEVKPKFHSGILTVSDEPWPSESDITESIENAIDENDPKVGDMFGLTRDGEFVLYGQLMPGEGDVGKFSRTVTEGEGENETKFRAILWQTGVYA